MTSQFRLPPAIDVCAWSKQHSHIQHEAQESMTHLKVIGDRFGEEIKELEHHAWELVMVMHSNQEVSIICSGKKMKVFICGDHEFLTRTYGLPGASSMSRYI